MGLFKKRKKEVIDERTELEKSFEEKGQQIGKDTGKIVQKSINKINELKEKYDSDNKLDKVRNFAGKAEKKVGKIVKKVTKKEKNIVENEEQ